ncbi:MAG: hypothetical protein ACREJN_19755, partial [Nitrospiraceae bacterium]
FKAQAQRETVEVAPPLRTAWPLRETGPSLHPGGACPLGASPRWGTRLQDQDGRCEQEDNMDQFIVCAVALVALRWWATVEPGRGAVAVQRQPRVGRSRVRHGAGV